MEMKPSFLYVLDAEDQPLAMDDVQVWGRWFEENHARRVVKQTDVGGFYVSTVFLGVDHNHGDGPPILWETMVFDKRTTREASIGVEYDCRRYSSRADALAGHNVTVELVKVHMTVADQERH